MKNLKKLSVAVMLAALFSTSFTSCIDGEVSPVVEAIYAAQADLLAAQAAVQEAEADLLAAQAAHEEAQAALLLAQAEAAADVAAGQLAVLLAQAGLTDAQAAYIMAEAQALADMTAAEVAVLLAEAGLIDAEAAAIAAMTEAEVALLLSHAAINNAYAMETLAIVAGIEADNAWEAMQREYELMVLMAETEAEVAEIQQEMALAAAEFEIQMALLISELNELGAYMAADYAEDYAYAMMKINQLELLKLQKQDWIAQKELMISGEVSKEYLLAQLNSLHSDLMAELAAKEMMVAELEAYMMDPDTYEYKTTMYQQEIAANDAENLEYDVQIAALENQIQDLYNLWYANMDLIDEYEDKLAFHDYLVDMRQALLDAIETWEDEIADWQDDLDNYAANLAALEAAVAAAETAEAAAEAAEDAAEAAEAAALAAYDAAHADLLALEADLASLEGSLNDAADDLASIQSDVDNGTLAAATAAAAGDVATAEANLIIAQAEYELWRDRFEGGPTVNGGYFWYDNGGGQTWADGILGLQGDNDNINDMSYVEVTTWGPSGITPGFVAPLEYGTPVASIPADGGGIDYEEWLQVFVEVDPNDLDAYTGNQIFYVEVGSDDMWLENLAQFQMATEALGAEEIFDTPPTAGDAFLGNGAIGGDDAYIDLWDAQLAYLDAMEAEANQLQDLADAQAEYDRLKAIFENELALLDAAQALDASTWQAWQDAADAEDIAEDAHDDAEDDLQDAEDDLDDFLDTSEQDLMDWIADNEADIAEAQLYVAEYTIGIEKALEEVLELQDAYDALMATPLMAQALVDIYELYDELWALEDMQDANDIESDAFQNLIDAMNSGGLEVIQAEIDACLVAIAALEEDIEEVEVDIAQGEAEIAMIERWIERAEETIASIDAEIAAWQALADKYKELMDAALAS